LEVLGGQADGGGGFEGLIEDEQGMFGPVVLTQGVDERPVFGVAVVGQAGDEHIDGGLRRCLTGRARLIEA
jgi:hypothetical protein